MKCGGVLVLAMLLLCGCTMRLADYHGYRGDGTFAAHAAPAAFCQDGYSVDLGSVDLAAPAEVTRQLEGLPSMKATIGLAIHKLAPASGTPRAAPSRRPTTAVIDISLRDENGRSVFARQEGLSTWEGSAQLAAIEHAYLYRRGPTWEVPQPSGAVRVEPIGVGADDGWGTYFTPRREGRYTLHFTVVEPDADLAGFEAHLQVEGVVGCL